MKRAVQGRWPMIVRTILGVLSSFGVAFMLYVLAHFHRESKRGRQTNVRILKRIRNESEANNIIYPKNHVTHHH